MHHTRDLSLEGFVGDLAKDLSLMCYSDADFAGGIKTSQSTSGCHLALAGPNTFVPLSGMRQNNPW